MEIKNKTAIISVAIVIANIIMCIIFYHVFNYKKPEVIIVLTVSSTLLLVINMTLTLISGNSKDLSKQDEQMETEAMPANHNKDTDEILNHIKDMNGLITKIYDEQIRYDQIEKLLKDNLNKIKIRPENNNNLSSTPESKQEPTHQDTSHHNKPMKSNHFKKNFYKTDKEIPVGKIDNTTIMEKSDAEYYYIKERTDGKFDMFINKKHIGSSYNQKDFQDYFNIKNNSSTSETRIIPAQFSQSTKTKQYNLEKKGEIISNGS